MILEYNILNDIDSKVCDINILQNEINNIFSNLVNYINREDNNIYIYLNRSIDDFERIIIDNIVKNFKIVNMDEYFFVNDKDSVTKLVGEEEVLFKSYNIYGYLDVINVVLNDDDMIITIYVDDKKIFGDIIVKDIINYFNNEFNNIKIDMNYLYAEYIVRINMNNIVVNNNLQIFLRRKFGEEKFTIKYVNIKYKI